MFLVVSNTSKPASISGVTWPYALFSSSNARLISRE